ncbi:Lrp/AsnC family transcriptional regulator [Jannaschia rubra]|uniref:Lrp/AsnC family transcriptional regulator n=1 Tax=Jannaschia rubra TaxID=282197 RepID=UPI00248FDF01|nr:winged helix-turn-helix transcriptional regulator [Jannaschia rubra]
MPLDRTDRASLAALQGDGRSALAALADRIGPLLAATAERVRRLQRDGVITGFRAVRSDTLLSLHDVRETRTYPAKECVVEGGAIPTV